jgi:gamma-glutamyl phosphate reductase
MIYKLCVTKNRIPYLKQQLGNNIVVVSEGEDTIHTVEITINSDMDALSLFHAGVMAGMSSNEIKAD